MSNPQRWKPSVTVAAVVERAGRYLLVEEHTREGLRLNNPAGHLDPEESLEQAVVREVLEETACRFTPEALVGIYLSRFRRLLMEPPSSPLRGSAAPQGGAAGLEAARQPACEEVTYLRFAFCGRVGDPDPALQLDEGIVRTVWMTPDEVRATQDRHRSPLVLQSVEDHLAGRRYPLQLLTAHPSLYDPWIPG